MSQVQSVETFTAADLARKAVKAAMQTGETVVPDALAQRLLIEHPYCDVTLAELSNEIARYAVANGMVVEFGSGSGF